MLLTASCLSVYRKPVQTTNPISNRHQLAEDRSTTRSTKQFLSFLNRT
jgi:hypothetical protein